MPILRINIPDKVTFKQKSIFFNILSTVGEEMISSKVIREEIILTNESFFNSSASNYGIELEARNFIMRTKLSNFLILIKKFISKEVQTPSKFKICVIVKFHWVEHIYRYSEIYPKILKVERSGLWSNLTRLPILWIRFGECRRFRNGTLQNEKNQNWFGIWISGIYAGFVVG